jgi:hypothetical protein
MTMPATLDAPRARSGVAGPGWIYGYLAVQIVCQLALLSTTLAPSRVIFRSAAFGTSILFLALVPGRTPRQSFLRTFGFVMMGILTLSALNPNGGVAVAVIAHWAFHLAILAPIFWVGRMQLSPAVLQRVLLILWAFHTAGSIAGLLQVYFPGQFQPALTIFIREKQALMIRLASGEWVPRPMGLSDTPGGVAASGFYAALFSLGLVLGRPFRYARAVGMLSMIAGVTSIYLSQVRSGVVVLGIGYACLLLQLIPSGRLPQLAVAAAIGLMVALGAFEVSLTLAGDAVTGRLNTLLAADPATIYQMNRGKMLDYGFSTLLPQYPLGAGLAHWGMILAYFGRPEDDIGAEIQIIGWILDGGLPLLLAYGGAVLVTVWNVYRIGARHTDVTHRTWACILVAYDVSTLALCFSYPPFMGTPGLEFWLLNATLIYGTPALAPPAPVPAPA